MSTATTITTIATTSVGNKSIPKWIKWCLVFAYLMFLIVNDPLFGAAEEERRRENTHFSGRRNFDNQFLFTVHAVEPSERKRERNTQNYTYVNNFNMKKKKKTECRDSISAENGQTNEGKGEKGTEEERARETSVQQQIKINIVEQKEHRRLRRRRRRRVTFFILKQNKDLITICRTIVPPVFDVMANLVNFYRLCVCVVCRLDSGQIELCFLAESARFLSFLVLDSRWFPLLLRFFFFFLHALPRQSHP